jgi:competence protein ComEC
LLAGTQARLQEKMRAALHRLFSGEDQALLAAMLLGVRESLSDQTRETFIATGLAHLMAVSGLHIGFVAGAAFFMLEPLVFYLLLRFSPDAARAGQARRIAASLCFLPLLFYLFLAAGQISAVRAAIIAGRERHLPNALLAAAVAILLVYPGAVLDVSFQLSFTAVASILLAFHLLKSGQDDSVARLGDSGQFRRLLLGVMRENYGGPRPRAGALKQRGLQLLIGSAFVSLVVFIGTLPIIVCHFNRLSLAGLLLNPLMVPLASLLIPFALFALSLAMVFPLAGGLLAPPVAVLIEAFHRIPTLFAQIPFASIPVPTPAALWVVLYYAALLAGAWSWLYRPSGKKGETPGWLPKPAWAGAFALGLFFFLFVPRLPAFGNGPLHITVLDVGQGESIYIEFPNRETMLIDGGGFYKNLLDIGNIVLAPFLWDRGLTRLDYLSVTHSDNDHIRGLESLLRLFPVGHFLDTFIGLPDRRIERLRRQARERSARLTPLTAGTPLDIGEVRLLPFHPSETFIRQSPSLAESGRIGNDLSLVLRIDYKNFSMLLTGDIGAEAEAHLLRQGAPLRANVLKGPHHGSRHSSHPAFIQAVAPQAVIFSSHDRSPWRHPHPEVIERYQQAGAEVWRTDQHGAVHIESGGHGFDIQGTVPH